jgi:DNA-binding FrmR family transcriptional regulator
LLFSLDKYPLGVYNILDEYSKRGIIIMEKCCCAKTKLRGEDEKKALINRLSRIEGQIRGIRTMVENDAYCADILIQASAVSAALGSFNKELLGEHIRSCVADDIKSGNDEKLDELISLLGRLMK